MVDISKNLSGLQPGTNYAVQVRTKNAEGSYSDWSPGYNFSTPVDLINTVNSTTNTVLQGGSLIAGDSSGSSYVTITASGITGWSNGLVNFFIPTASSDTAILGTFGFDVNGLIGYGQTIVSATTTNGSGSVKVPISSASLINPGQNIFASAAFQPNARIVSVNKATGVLIITPLASATYASGISASIISKPNMIVGTSASNNITIRGQGVPGQTGAIFTNVSGVPTTASTGLGFYIDETGRFRLAGANGVVSMDGSGNLAVSGSIVANSGSIGGFSIASDKLSSSFSTSSYVAVSGSGDYAFWAGNPTASLAPFWIKMDGTSKVTGVQVGNVGGFTITSSALWGGTSPNIVGLDPSNATYSIFSGATASSGTGAKFWVTTSGSVYGTAASFQSPILSGGTLSGTSTNSGSLVGGAIVVPATSPKFTVDSSGNLTATNAYISGSVYANSGSFTGAVYASVGSFTGSVTANSGSIGAFNITQTALYSGGSGSVVGLDPTNATYSFFAGATASTGAGSKFWVTNSGSVYGTAASFVGPVFSGTVNLQNAVLYQGATGSISGGALVIPATNPKFTVDSLGNVVAQSASITGFISASSGSVGGWSINTGSLTSGTGASAVGISTGNYAFYAGNVTASSAPFSVTNTGILTASGANISGSLTATTGSIGGFTITGSALYGGTSGSITGFNPYNASATIFAGATSSAGDNAKFYVTNSGSIYSTGGASFTGPVMSAASLSAPVISGSTTNSGSIIGGAIFVPNAGSPAFKVDSSGNMTASNAYLSGSIVSNSGSIANWQINTGSLTAGTGASAVGISTGNYAFYAGNTVPSAASFSVTNTGILTATNANISGSINASSGTFSGTLNATTGSIGGFTISNNNLSTSNISLSSATGLNLGPNQFTVSQTGAMVAQTASITGQITAQSGSFTGDVYIQSPGRLIAQSGTNSVILTSTGLTGNQSGIPVFTLPTDGSPPTIGQFKIVQTGLSAVGLVTITASTTSGSSTALVTASNASSLWAGMSAYGGGFASATVITSVNQSTGAIGLSVAASATNAGFTASMIPNANMVIGTTASNNITIRGQNSPGQVGAIFSVISGSNTVPGSASGFYVDQAGAFWLGSGAGNYLSASNGNLSVSGSIVATSGSFSGAINASAGTFTGSVGALTGSIGGWSISSSALTSSNVGLYAPNSPAVSEIAIFAGSAIANRSTAPFRIDYSGNMTASNANISGSINANSGSIAGWNITSGSLIATGASISGTGGLAFGSPAKFTVDTSGNLTAQNISASGSIAASAGSVGGWAISSSALTSASVGLYAPVSPSATEIAIFAGSALGSRNTAPFRVDYSGNLTASNANISGSIIANSGSIANWTISTGSLTSGTGASAVGITTGSYAFYAGSATASSAPFSVTNTGNLVASNSNISGSISASAGRIGLGSSTTWYIGTDYDGQGVIKNYPLSASTPAYVSPGAYGGYSANYSASYNDYIVGYFPTSIEIDSSPYIHLQPAYNGPSVAVDPRQGLILDPNGNGSYGVLDINGNVRYDTVLWWGYGDIRDSQSPYAAPFYITSGGNMFASSAYISNLTTLNSSVSTITASSINSNIINSGQVNTDNINATNMSLGIIQGQGAAFAFSATPLSAQSDGLGYVTYTVSEPLTNGFYEYGIAVGETILISGMQNSTVKNADIYNGKFTIVNQNFSDANQTFAVYNPAAIGVYEYLSPNPAAYGVVDNATVIADSTGNMEIGPQYQVPISYDGTIPRGLSEGDIYYDIKKLAPYPSFYEIINDTTSAGSAARNITNSGAPYLPVKGISNMQVNVPTDGVLEATFGGNLYWLGAASTLSITSYIAASVVPTVFSMIDLAPNGSNGIIFTTNYNNINGEIGSKTIIQTSSSPFYYNSVNTSSITLTSVTQGTPTTASIIPIGNLFTSSAVVATNANNGNNTIVDGMWIKALPTSGTGFSGIIQNITTGNFVTGSISISATSASTSTPSAYFVSSGTVTGNDVTSGMLIQDANAKSYQVYNVTTDTNNNVIGLTLSSSTNATALVSASIYNAIAISSSMVTASIHSASINNLGYVTNVDDNGNAAYISGTGSISASTAYSLGPSNSSNSPFMQLTLPGTGYNAPFASIGPVTRVWPLVNVPSGGVTLDFAYWAKLGSPNSASPNMQYSSWIFKYFPYAAHSYFAAASVV
jgi:hypothetical protein